MLTYSWGSVNCKVEPILSKLLWSSKFSSIIIKKAGRATSIFRSPSGFPDSSIHSRSSQQLCRWHHHQHSQYLISSIISIIFDNILLIFISSLSRAQRERMSCLWTRCASSATSPRRWPGETPSHVLIILVPKPREEFTAPPREGAYIHGLFMEVHRHRIHHVWQKKMIPRWYDDKRLSPGCTMGPEWRNYCWIQAERTPSHDAGHVCQGI